MNGSRYRAEFRLAVSMIGTALASPTVGPARRTAFPYDQLRELSSNALGRRRESSPGNSGDFGAVEKDDRNCCAEQTLVKDAEKPDNSFSALRTVASDCLGVAADPTVHSFATSFRELRGAIRPAVEPTLLPRNCQRWRRRRWPRPPETAIAT